jgi:hypothetical protein
MTVKKKSTKQNAPRGGSRAAQNRKIRRDALREELKSKEYIRQLTAIEQRLDPGSKDTYDRDDIPMVKERVSILFKMLDKILPNLRPVDMPVQIPVCKTIANQGTAIIKAMSIGQITPSEATSLMQALSSHVKIVEAEELNERVKALEEAHG